MKIFKTFLMLTSITLFITACTDNPNNANTANTANSQKNTTANITPAPTLSEVASGGKLYKEHCARCHQDDGTGGKVEIGGKTLKVDNLTSDKMKKEPDAEYIEYMVKGIPDEGMPSFRDEMTDEQMKQVVKYIREDLQK